MKLFELADLSERAGFIPYYFDDNGVPVFYFMIPSKEEFGGINPQVAKGRIDKGETVLDAAFREAKEELGLKKSNIKQDTVKLVFRGKIKGSKETYMMSVFMGEVKKKQNFKEPHHETGSTHWLTMKEFAKDGLPRHVNIVRQAANLLKQNQNK